MTGAEVRRTGVSLVEVLVAVAAFGVLIGLLLPAVQKVRSAAALADSKSEQRQIVFTLHHASELLGGLPYTPLPVPRTAAMFAPGRDPRMGVIMQYVLYLSEDRFDLFYSRSDPGMATVPPNLIGKGGFFHVPCSYVYNAEALRRPMQLGTSFADGTAGTFALCEKYAVCGEGDLAIHNGNTWNVWLTPPLVPPDRRPSFADGELGDVVPVTSGGVTLPSVPGKTFRAAPRVAECDKTTPNSLHPSGLVAAMFDGSVRVVSPGVSPAAFWAAVTPAAGETTTLD